MWWPGDVDRGRQGRIIVEKAILGHRSAAERAQSAAEALKEVPTCHVHKIVPYLDKLSGWPPAEATQWNWEAAPRPPRA